MNYLKSFTSSALLSVCFIVFSFQIYAKEGEKPLCETGNFSLPPSQQPGPLVGFGETIILHNQVQLSFFGDDFIGKDSHFVDLVPYLTYGITDTLSVLFGIPLAAIYKSDKYHSHGLEDIFVQFEYAIFTKRSSCSADQITLVADASFPTGSSHKIPSTGFGSMSYFVGTTYNHTEINWFFFTAYGAELPTSHHGIKFGNQYLYQLGFGRDIITAKGWLLAWIAELDGFFLARNKINGLTDHDSGGNRLYFTPSLWASSKDWILQLGLGYAVQHHLFGNQKTNKYLLVFNFARTF